MRYTKMGGWVDARWHWRRIPETLGPLKAAESRKFKAPLLPQSIRFHENLETAET